MNQVHIYKALNGHCDAVDCWCEPSAIYLYRNPYGIVVLIVEHDDNEPMLLPRSSILYLRDQAQDWITRHLNGINCDPPSDHNERNIP